jgi:galactokinase
VRPAREHDERHHRGRIDAQGRIAGELPHPERARWFRAPGRVNLVGDHTDYNDGLVLPFAIDRSCVVAAVPASTVRIRSLDLDAGVEIRADGSTDPASVSPSWGRYVAGVVRELAAAGRPPAGLEAVLASDVPLGSGLSSSAALEIACAVALADAADWHPGEGVLAEACRVAEETATGVPCGIMDQLVSLAGRDGAALLIDCRLLELHPVPLPDRLAVLVVHSGIARSLDASGYGERRRACEALARRLGLDTLRDATAEQVADEPLGRHVVSENARVLEAERALEQEDLEALGRIFGRSHVSLAEDFRVSTPELDTLVDVLVHAGAYGARLTGAGFGGCAVAACDIETVARVAREATAGYRERTRLEPTAFVCRPVAGAGPFEPDLTRLSRGH